MSEQTINQTSSIGASWPPATASNNRMRGFYNSVIASQAEVEEFVGQFMSYGEQAAQDPEIDRLSIRVVAHTGVLSMIDTHGIGLEGALPIRGSDLVIAYTAWNSPSRQAGCERLIEHGATIRQVTTSPRTPTHQVGLQPQIIDQTTPIEEKLLLAPKFRDLYGRFGYDEEEVMDLVVNPANTIAYVEDQWGVVSTAMAETAMIRLSGLGELRVAEITEAITRTPDRGKGLYRAISGHLTRRLVDASTDTGLDVIYGECNLAMKGVMLAAHHNGRSFSFLDREKFGVIQPNFGILQQNFSVEDGAEDRRYNDFALSYVPLD